MRPNIAFAQAHDDNCNGVGKSCITGIESRPQQNLKILAVDRADAERKARDEANMDNADVKLDFVYAREVKR